jgi:hypothetical protein
LYALRQSAASKSRKRPPLSESAPFKSVSTATPINSTAMAAHWKTHSVSRQTTRTSSAVTTGTVAITTLAVPAVTVACPRLNATIIEKKAYAAGRENPRQIGFARQL